MIKILSKKNFDKLISIEGINDGNVENIKNVAFISVLNSPSNNWFGEDQYYMNSIFEKEHNNVLILTFDDVENSINGNISFDEKMANKLIEFIDQNKNRDFIIHCAAGISRSGAIGTFIKDYLELNSEEFKKYNPYVQPNSHVLRVLNKIFWDKKYK